MSGIDANSVLSLRNAVIQRSDALRNAARPDAAQSADFGKLLGAVNAAQGEASAASAAYERGETSDIAGVMLARQKSSIAFEATLQVRNKLLSAYRDIMNMPV
jgi:flagellar hook-basal body complex protein FliE